jgi:hypothetical protein
VNTISFAKVAIGVALGVFGFFAILQFPKPPIQFYIQNQLWFWVCRRNRRPQGLTFVTFSMLVICDIITGTVRANRHINF